LNKLGRITQRHHMLGDRLNRQVQDIPGIHPHVVEPSAYCTYWFYLFRIDSNVIRPDRGQFVKALNAEGVLAAGGYIPAPVYRYPVFQNHNFFGGRWPVKDLGLTQVDYRKVVCPEAEAILESCVSLPIRPDFDEAYIDGVARALRKVAACYAV